MFRNALTGRIVESLTAVGIPVVPAQLEGECFLPGIRVESGSLFVDEAKLPDAAARAQVRSDSRMAAPLPCGGPTAPPSSEERLCPSPEECCC